MLSKGDQELLSLWAEGATLDVASERFQKTPTSIASKLVRLGVFEDRASVNVENKKRGGNSMAALEHDGIYTIYIIRDPGTKAPVYVGQSQNFRKRKKSHVRYFSKKWFAGQTALIETVEIAGTYALARQVERAMIAKLIAAGYGLRNVLDRDQSDV